jgi:hypothetical protein
MKKTLLYAGAAVIAAGIIPVVPASAGPTGPCSGKQPMETQTSSLSPCGACTAQTHSFDVCYWGGPPPDSGGSVSPPQGICNLTGACGQSYVTQPRGYHTCPADAPVQQGIFCTWGPVTPPEPQGGKDLGDTSDRQCADHPFGNCPAEPAEPPRPGPAPG